MQQQYHLYQSWLWLFLLPLLCLTSCSGADTDDAGSQHPATSSVPISFTALSKWDEAQAKSSSAPHTRLSEDANTNAVSFTKNDAIGVFAYLNNSDTPNFMNNQEITYDGANWSYSPVKYWPSNEVDKLSFYAYYPYRETSDGDTIKAVSSSNNKLTINYCCPNANIDLMVSKEPEEMNYSSHQGSVPLSFLHLLARVRFTFTYTGSDAYHPVIHVLKYTIPHYKATFTCYTGENGDEFTWGNTMSDYTDTTQIVRYVSDVAGTVLHEKNQLIPEFTAYLLPNDFPYSPTAKDNIGNFTISLNNKLYTYTPGKQIPLKSGKSYTVNFNITNETGGIGNYFITSYSIWKDGGTINGTLE